MMKKLLCVVLAVAGLVLMSKSAEAKKLTIFYHNGPNFSVTNELPDSVLVDSLHVNFGVGFDQFAIFWIPIWNYGETEYVLISDDGNTGYRLDEEDLAYLKEEYHIDTDKAPSIPFWHTVGGKLVWCAVLILVLWGYFSKNSKKEEEAPSAS